MRQQTTTFFSQCFVAVGKYNLVKKLLVGLSDLHTHTKTESLKTKTFFLTFHRLTLNCSLLNWLGALCKMHQFNSKSNHRLFPF